MQINHNITAMNTLRQLNINSNAQAKSMSKLSSGLRINSAADDAAGLSISEKMKGQIRGLDQASRNAQDGISMISTAEGALGETQDILQRMRELATQAANGTNTDQDRDAIQKETNALTSEINRIGNTTEFNTQSLLKGDGKANLTKSSLVTDGTLKNGADAYKTQAIAGNTVAGDVSAIANGDTLTYTVNGQQLQMTFDTADTTLGTGGEVKSGVTGNAAHINLGADFANSNAGRTDVANATKDALQAMIDANDTLKGQYTVKVDGANSDKVVIEAVKGGEFDGAASNIQVASSLTTATFANDATITAAGTDVTAQAASTTIDFTNNTGLSVDSKSEVEALVGKGMTINGQQVEFYDATKGSYKGDAIGINISDAVNATANWDQALATTLAAQIGDKVEGVDTSAATGVLTISASEAGSAGNNIEVKDGGVQKDFQATFQIGANSGQTMTIDIKDMRSQALDISSSNGGGTVKANNGQEASFVKTANVTDGTDNNNVEYSLDLSSTDKATAAISVIDDAINKVSTQRSALGAYTNRLDHTINNLNTSSQNITDASSRITDVDMASEMMNQTKSSVLAQAAQAMLAQANQQPQQVLQLLR